MIMRSFRVGWTEVARLREEESGEDAILGETSEIARERKDAIDGAARSMQ